MIGVDNMMEFKSIIKGFSALFIYLILTYLISLPFILFNIDIDGLSQTFKFIYMALYESLILIILVYLFKDHLKEKWIDLKNNHKSYFNKYFKYWLLAIGLMSISNGIIQLFDLGVAENQTIIEEMFNESPLFIFFSAVILAPFLEELVFRLGFRYIFRTDYLFIFFSGITFGLLHIAGSDNLTSELIFLIPYSIPGFIFAYVLTKSKNIFVPIGLHFIHNGFIMALQFLILFIK
jgi:uncharacterized protein